MKLERLMAITILLLNRKRVQAQELADRLEVSLRTVYRDLESLGQAGIPIVSYTGVEGGYEIMDSFRLDRQLLSYEELYALLTALRGLQSTQAMDRSNMDRLLNKVGALLSQAEQKHTGDGEQVQIDFTPWKNSAADREKYESLRQAVQDRQLIRFTYAGRQGEENERSVEPVGLVLKRYVWYLHGYCRLREDYRIFRLSRIRNLLVLAEVFVRRAESLDTLNERWQPAFNEETVELVLQFAEAVKIHVIDQFDETAIQRQQDGTLLVRAALPNGPWLIGMLLRFGTNVLVLEPASIAAEVRRTALEIAARYGETGDVADRDAN